MSRTTPIPRAPELTDAAAAVRATFDAALTQMAEGFDLPDRDDRDEAEEFIRVMAFEDES
jgi:hypothetical protein